MIGPLLFLFDYDRDPGIWVLARPQIFRQLLRPDNVRG